MHRIGLKSKRQTKIPATREGISAHLIVSLSSRPTKYRRKRDDGQRLGVKISTCTLDGRRQCVIIEGLKGIPPS